MADFSYTATQGYAFDWMTTPGQCGTPAAVLNDPKNGTPRPCKHGEGCYWKGHTRRGEGSHKDEENGRGCGFVHPGEEGIARRLFPGRTITHEDGRQTWEPPVVRLVGNATFYERRRLGLSWPEWQAKQAQRAKVNAEKAEKPMPARVTSVENTSNVRGGFSSTLANARVFLKPLRVSALRAEAATWSPPLLSSPPPTHYHKPQQMMLSAWFPPLPPSTPRAPSSTPISAARLEEELMVKAMLDNPAISEPARAMCKQIIADVLKGVAGNPAMYGWNPQTQQVVTTPLHFS